LSVLVFSEITALAGSRWQVHAASMPVDEIRGLSGGLLMLSPADELTGSLLVSPVAGELPTDVGTR
jgi:hypothetical protein